MYSSEKSSVHNAQARLIMFYYLANPTNSEVACVRYTAAFAWVWNPPNLTGMSTVLPHYLRAVIPRPKVYLSYRFIQAFRLECRVDHAWSFGQ